jgi:putative endonuclease
VDTRDKRGHGVGEGETAANDRNRSGHTDIPQRHGRCTFSPRVVTAIHGQHTRPMRRCFYVYINRPNGTLYIGVTNDIARRAWEHREGIFDGFTKRYGLKRLVYFEVFDSIVVAIQREKTMKHWSRAWKVRLIMRTNPEWDDLYETLI